MCYPTELHTPQKVDTFNLSVTKMARSKYATKVDV
ncbi:uncharacterized protein CPUR_08129 [Claviceps purpurea 20.1]|uniref:Uncharacterized protein n=1 Tax=Claviceps purpurea (strain 20.1) TaxID=1111077 RepID=M1VYM6_CLAP2|nr:uncharacterized protein CPUR_08129 [Claviceps purpurea 20.1]